MSLKALTVASLSLADPNPEHLQMGAGHSDLFEHLGQAQNELVLNVAETRQDTVSVLIAANGDNFLLGAAELDELEQMRQDLLNDEFESMFANLGPVALALLGAILLGLSLRYGIPKIRKHTRSRLNGVLEELKEAGLREVDIPEDLTRGQLNEWLTERLIASLKDIKKLELAAGNRAEREAKIAELETENSRLDQDNTSQKRTIGQLQNRVKTAEGELSRLQILIGASSGGSNVGLNQSVLRSALGELESHLGNRQIQLVRQACPEIDALFKAVSS